MSLTRMMTPQDALSGDVDQRWADLYDRCTAMHRP